MSDALDPEIAALLDTERGRPAPAAGPRSRVLERVQTSVAAHPVSGRAPRMRPAFARTLLRPALAAALLLGAGAAVALAIPWRPALPRVEPAIPVVPPVSSASPPVVPPPPLAPSVAPVPVTVTRAPEPVIVRPAPVPSVKVETPPSTMQAERVLLDRARRDLLSGEASAALEEVETHARLYRRGVLGEERDALRVEALVAMRRYEQAQTAGSRFRAAYPQSMLGPAVDGALGTIP